MAKKQDDNENIRKKLAADGGSQPSKVEIIKIYKDYDSKIKYLTKIISERYVQNPHFYLQRAEFAAMHDIISKDCVYCVNAPLFDYNGSKHAVGDVNIAEQHKDMLRLNRLFIFYSFGRLANGDLAIQGKYV